MIFIQRGCPVSGSRKNSARTSEGINAESFFNTAEATTADPVGITLSKPLMMSGKREAVLSGLSVNQTTSASRPSVAKSTASRNSFGV